MLSIQIDTQSLVSVQQYQIVVFCKQYENEFVQLLDALDDIRNVLSCCQKVNWVP